MDTTTQTTSRRELKIYPGSTYCFDPATQTIVRVETTPDGSGMVHVKDPGDKEGTTLRTVSLGNLRTVPRHLVRKAQIADGVYVAPEWREYTIRGGVKLRLEEVLKTAGIVVLTLCFTHPALALSGIALVALFKGAGSRPPFVPKGQTSDPKAKEQFTSANIFTNGLPADANWTHPQTAPFFTWDLPGDYRLYARQFSPEGWFFTLSHPTQNLRWFRATVASKGEGLRPVNDDTSRQDYESYSKWELRFEELPEDKRPRVVPMAEAQAQVAAAHAALASGETAATTAQPETASSTEGDEK